MDKQELTATLIEIQIKMRERNYNNKQIRKSVESLIKTYMDSHSSDDPILHHLLDIEEIAHDKEKLYFAIDLLRIDLSD